MLTVHDERNGLVMTTWDKVSERVRHVEPNMAAIIDEISPGKDYPLFLAYYPYGVLTGDKISTILPSVNGGFFRLTDPDAPKEVIEHLSYGADSAPFTLILEKNCEFFIEIPNEKLSVPVILYQPGTFFPLSRFLRQLEKRVYAPNNVLSTMSGVRSTFMLPTIGRKQNITKLKRSLGIETAYDTDLYEQAGLFRDIAGSSAVNSEWRSCLLFFSQKWHDALLADKRFNVLLRYLLEVAWQRTAYFCSYDYYDITFSLIQKKYNMKPNPYLADTARHLFTIAMGKAPGFSPAVDEDSVPLADLQRVFVDIYGLSQYLPTIIVPKQYVFEEEDYPIYYSLQYPSTYKFSPKSRAVSSTLYDLRELKHIMDKFMHELSDKNSIHTGTIINNIAKDIAFDYYQSKEDKYNLIHLSSHLVEKDNRFTYMAKSNNSLPNAKFAADGKFVRGCVAIRKKQANVI
ncbi:MAG: hypothetical protein K0R12_1351 [Gammaproteobacteria bacterium]|jgi:hypothetical protein|nr:hypothetical protein [Gammaproteobacteria bacterium]